MYKEMVYALDDVLGMKFKCTSPQKRMIIRDVIKSKKSIKDPTIYLYETLLFDGIFVVVDHDTHMDVSKCLYYTFCDVKKRLCKVSIKKDRAQESSLITT